MVTAAVWAVRLLLVLSFAWMAYGCAAPGGTFHVEPVPEGHVSTIAGGQGPRLVSRRANSIVIIEAKSPMYSAGQRPGFNVLVQNESDYGFNFGLSNIRVQYNAIPLEVVRPEILVQEAVNEAEAAKKAANRAETFGFLTALVGTAVNASTTVLSESEDLVDLDSFLLDTTLDSLDAAVQNSAAGARVAAEQADLAQSKADQVLERYRSEMLKEQAVKPKGKYGGYFYAMPMNADEIGERGFIDVLIDLDDEHHDFRFEINPVVP